MNLVIEKQFSPERVAEILTYLQEGGVLQQLKPDKSSYAPGRKVIWLHQEPTFGREPSYRKATEAQRLWTFLQRITSEHIHCALVAQGAGIDWHRDASYAASTAWILNLGPCTWEYCLNRQATVSSLEAEQISRLNLQGGELLRFNCKHLHRAIAAPDRIAIGIWQPK